MGKWWNTIGQSRSTARPLQAECFVGITHTHTHTHTTFAIRKSLSGTDKPDKPIMSCCVDIEQSVWPFNITQGCLLSALVISGEKRSKLDSDRIFLPHLVKSMSPEENVWKPQLLSPSGTNFYWSNISMKQMLKFKSGISPSLSEVNVQRHLHLHFIKFHGIHVYPHPQFSWPFQPWWICCHVFFQQLVHWSAAFLRWSAASVGFKWSCKNAKHEDEDKHFLHHGCEMRWFSTSLCVSVNIVFLCQRSCDFALTGENEQFHHFW